MTLRRTLPWLFLLPVIVGEAPAAPQGQTQEESIYLEKVDRDFLERVKKAEQARDWKSLFDLYGLSLRKYSQSVVQVSPDRWTSVHEYFLGRISALPKEAFEYYRFQNDGKARAALDKAHESGRRRDVERVVEEYFFATGSDEVMDGLALQDYDEGKVEEARTWWNRLLRLYPDSHLPRAVTAARIAHACLISENVGALEDLRRFLAASKIDGAVTIGGRSRPLSEYLQSLAIPLRPLAVRPTKMPYSPDPEERLRRPTLGVRNDIRRWVYDFAEDRGDAPAVPEPEVQRPQVRQPFRPRGMRGDVPPPPPVPEYPLIPAYAKVRGKDYVIFTDGTRVLAVDPARVKGKSATAGVYWKYPSDKPIPRPQPGQNGTAGRPYVGVTIDAEYAFVTMYSSPEARPRDPTPAGNQDGFEGVTAVKCIHIPTGKLVWDTDLPPLIDEFKTACKEYIERNFSYAAPPIVRGDRLYLGVCTSPMGEQESRVVCLDRKTGRPLWSTFLSSVTTQQGAFMGMTYQPTYLPMLAEQGGTLYVETNLGVVGALNPASGALLWLSQYKRAGRRYQPNTGTTEAAFRRPANPPILWNGTLFVLAQDRADLLAFNAATGDEIKLPPSSEMHGELDWKSILHLLGPVNDELVVTGANKSFQVKLRDENGPCYRANYLIASACRGAGRGAVTEDYVYLPVMDDGDGSQTGGLGVYDVRTWKVVERPAWKEPNECGNLLVAGNCLVVATSRIAVYTDVDTLRNQYARRLGQSPPNPELLLEYGETMRENDRLEEAGEAYLSFIHAVDGDPRQAEKAREVRRELHTIFIRRGDEALKRSGDAASRVADAVRRQQEAKQQLEDADRKADETGKLQAAALIRSAEMDQRQADAARKTDSEKALECFRFAKEFAWDRDSEADAVQRLAGTYEGLGLWREAVAQYQELILKGRTLFHRESESVTKLWEHASRRIDDIVAKAPGAYADVEKQAAEALQKAKDGSVEGLREVMDRFPNSKAARDAFGRMRDTLLKQGHLDKLRALYGDFQDRFKLKLDFDAYKELLELLEKLGDLDRLKFELAHFGERFQDRSVMTDGRDEPVKEFVARKLDALSRAPRHAPELKGPLRLLGELEPVLLSSDPQGVALGHQPLCPLGTEPPGLGADRELFRRGSTVELWDLKAHQRIWASAHPGSWIGVVYGDAPQGVPVLFVKPGSPADKAGLKKDDVILAVDGQPVKAPGLGDVLSGLPPQTTVEIAGRRGGADLRVKLVTVPMPPELRPAILGASFTREGALAVAWEDQLASMDLATGRIQWTFRISRDRFVFSAFHATDGRVYLYESFRGDRFADPMRLPTPGAPQTFKVQEAHHLLFCLSDFTGEVLWARKFDFDPAVPVQETRVEFLGRYFADYVSFLHMMNRGSVSEWSLWLIPSQSGGKSELGPLREPQRRPLHGDLRDHAVDTDGEILYYVADVTDRRERTLHSLSLDPAQSSFKPVDIRLSDVKYMPYQFNYSTCKLAASREFITLVVSPPQPNIEYRIWTWKTSDLKDRSFSLLPGRTLPVARPAGLGIGPDDTLYVYNVPRDQSPAQTIGRAYLTAFRLQSPPGADPVAWDSKAPSVNDMTGATMIHGAGMFEVLAAPRASQAGEVAENPAVIVYDRQAEGTVRMDRTDLVQPGETPGEPRPPAVAWRGRIYILSQKALEIYGD
ncbi:MAG TPA: PQQ-binding-like beta-propeller repeat protein [Planctomycetota bacterium]|nr:PQQ-binding-like beta-propeller repeat protein [Planctomycetota bacterium]